MRFTEMGNPDNPTIVMLPAMMCSGSLHLPVARVLAEDFHVVLPTYDGHCLDGSHYTSAPDQCAKICAHLDGQGIEDIALVQGSSMGAEIALELLRERPQIRNAFFDGGPFFNFPRPIRRMLTRAFMGIAEKANSFSSDERAIEGFAASEKIRSRIPPADKVADGVNANEVLQALLADMVPIARSMDRATIENLGETCYSCILPAFDESIQRRMTFYYGKEPAAMARTRMQRAYPHARFLRGTMGHCTFELTHPQEYVKLLVDACR